MCSAGKFNPKLAWSLPACTKIHCPAPGFLQGLPGGERGTGHGQHCTTVLGSFCRAPQHPQSCHPSSQKGPECSAPSPGDSKPPKSQFSCSKAWQDKRTSLGQAAKGQAHTSPLLGAAGTPATGGQFCSCWGCGLEQLQQTASAASQKHKDRLRAGGSSGSQQGDPRAGRSRGHCSAGAPLHPCLYLPPTQS